MTTRFPLVIACLLLAAPSLADWPDDPGVNLPISLAPGDKSDVFGVSDGAGGAILVWEDRRTGDRDLYAQRVAADGQLLWTSDGVPVCTAPGHQALDNSSTGTTGLTPVVADGEGGVWIVWQDERAFASRQRDIYAQRLDADGLAYFTTGGIPVATGAGMEDGPTACTDGQGGVIVAWQDKNADPVFFDVWGQRLSATGEPSWNGGQPLPLVTVDWDQDGLSLCADDQGGAFLAWSDSRDDVGDVYAQRLAADGTSLWLADGVPVCTRSGGQDAITARLASDGDLLLAWVDRRGSGPDIYAQKLDADAGTGRWEAGGHAVAAVPESQYRPAMTGDDAGGAIVAWFDYRNAPSGPPWNLDIYAQRVTAEGTDAWPAGGVSICGAPDAQRDVDLVGDGQGGAILAWEDNRGGDGLEDIYAQHVRPDGTVSGTVDGVPVSTAANNQKRPELVAGAGGAIIAWPDDRDLIYEADIYGARLQTLDPTAAPPAVAVEGLHVRTRVDASIDFALPRAARVTMSIYDLRGRRHGVPVRDRWFEAGAHHLAWSRAGAGGRPLPSGFYLVELRANGARAMGKLTIVR